MTPGHPPESDNYVANGSEPWLLPDVDSIPKRSRSSSPAKPNGPDGTFLPYMRDIDTFARPWAVPGNNQGWSTA